MSNSMKDLLLGLGFKPAPEQPRPQQHRDVKDPRAQGPQRTGSGDVRERPSSKPERNDAARHPNQPDPLQRPPSQRPPAHRPGSQPRNHAHAAAHAVSKPGAEQGARVDRPRREQPPQRTREEIDLAKAYAIRAQKEKDERIEAERLKQEAARIKREAKAKIAELLKDKTLNATDAEHVRHFDYNGKIRRVHVTETQLKALNKGDLGLVQLDGRYLLVDASLAREASALLPSLLALLVDPDAPATDDPYADPQYQVPDDIVW
jgi:uncharacterized protein YaiL (DUF2058 family)